MNVELQKTRVLYYDYLGFEHRAVVALMQPCEAPDVEPPDEEGMVYYLYLVDDNPIYNDKTYTNNGATLKYAEIRRSDECVPCYSRDDVRLNDNPIFN